MSSYPVELQWNHNLRVGGSIAGNVARELVDVLDQQSPILLCCCATDATSKLDGGASDLALEGS